MPSYNQFPAIIFNSPILSFSFEHREAVIIRGHIYAAILPGHITVITRGAHYLELQRPMSCALHGTGSWLPCCLVTSMPLMYKSHYLLEAVPRGFWERRRAVHIFLGVGQGGVWSGRLVILWCWNGHVKCTVKFQLSWLLYYYLCSRTCWTTFFGCFFIPEICELHTISYNKEDVVGSQVKGAKCVFHTFEKIEFKGLNRQLKFRKCI